MGQNEEVLTYCSDCALFINVYYFLVFLNYWEYCLIFVKLYKSSTNLEDISMYSLTSLFFISEWTRMKWYGRYNFDSSQKL